MKLVQLSVEMMRHIDGKIKKREPIPNMEKDQQREADDISSQADAQRLNLHVFLQAHRWMIGKERDTRDLHRGKHKEAGMILTTGLW